MTSVFKKKEKSIEELRVELERELIGAKMRNQRNDLLARIGKAKAAGKGKNGHNWEATKGRLFEAGNFLKDEITFYGNNVRDNIEREQGRGKAKKQKKGMDQDDFNLVGDLV
jgi:hypothetical protein